MFCNKPVVSLLLYFILLLPCPSFSLRFHGKCQNFANRGDVTDIILAAFENGQDIANNAWKNRMKAL